MVDKFHKMVDWAKKLYSQGLFSPQNLGLYLIAVLSISVMYSGSKVIQQNYQLTQEVSQIEQENRVIQLENRNKELKNAYYATDEYADITARSSYGKALRGERVYIISSQVSEQALGLPAEQPSVVEDRQDIPGYRKNIQAWLNIYFGSR